MLSFWPLKHLEIREFERRLGRMVVEPWRRGQTRKSLLDIQPHAFLLTLVCFVRSFRQHKVNCSATCSVAIFRLCSQLKRPHSLQGLELDTLSPLVSPLFRRIVNTNFPDWRF
jgi:hypothetical protein